MNYSVVVELKAICDEFTKELNKAENTVNKLEKTEEKLAKQSEKMGNAMDKAGSKSKKMGADLEATTKKMGMFEKGLASVGGALKGFVLGYLAFSTIKKVVGTLGELDLMMSKIATNTHASKEEVRDLGKTIIDLSPKTMFGADELMHTAFMRSKTDSVAKIKQDMAVVAQLAMVTPEKNLDMASSTLSTIQNIFKDRSTVDIANAVMRATDGASMSIMEYAEAFKTAGIAGKQYGKTMEEVNAMIATLAAGGVKGSVAGSALLAFFNQLSKAGSSKQGVMALKALGLTFKDINPNAKTTQEIVENMSKGLDKLDRTAKSKVLQALFGSGQQATFASSLLNIKQYNKDLQQQNNEHMTVAKGAEAQMQTLGGATKGLIGDVKGLMYAFAPLIPILTDTIEFIRLLTQSLGLLIKGFSYAIGGAYDIIKMPFKMLEPTELEKQTRAEVEAKYASKREELASKTVLQRAFSLDETKLNQQIEDEFNATYKAKLKQIKADNFQKFQGNQEMQKMFNINPVDMSNSLKSDNKITVILDSKNPNVSAEVQENKNANMSVANNTKRNFLT